MLKRKTQRADAPISTDTAAVLLRGWGAHPPAGESDGPGFGGGMFELFDGRDAAFAAMWRKHEAYLRRLAAAWGWAAEDGDDPAAPLFFAEAIAAGISRPHARSGV